MTFSTRSYLPERESPLHRAQCQAQQQGAVVADLIVSNPTLAHLDYSHYRATSGDSAGDQWAPVGPLIGDADGRSSSPRYQPDPLGLQSAREAICAHWHHQRFRPRPEHIALTTSTSEAYHRLFTLLCDPGDEVLAPEPSYPLFAQLAQFANVRLVPYSLEYDGAWHIDFESLQRERTERTRAVITVSPNNPTGNYTGRQQLHRLSQLKLPIVSDEVFARYPLDARDDELTSALGQTDALTFCLDGLSKSAGLPQLKLAWIAVSGPVAACTESMRRLAWQGDTYLSTATPVQQALPELLRQSADFRRQLLPRLRRNLAALRAALTDSPATVLRAAGGWYAIVRLPATATDEQWAMALLEHGRLLLHPGYYYDLSGPPHCVVSLLAPSTQFARAAKTLRRAIDNGTDP